MSNKQHKHLAGSRLKVQARLMLDEEIAFGPGKADLLDAIHATGSISAAGKQLGMSYRRTWMLVDSMNRCFQQPLVETVTGGAKGGGSQLSALGVEALKHYRELQAAIDLVTREHFPVFQPLLRSSPLPATA